MCILNVIVAKCGKYKTVYQWVESLIKYTKIYFSALRLLIKNMFTQSWTFSLVNDFSTLINETAR